MWHLGKLLVLPLIAMIAGLTSLYIDPKQNPWGKKILLAVLLIGAAGSVAIAVSDDHDQQKEDQKASDNARDMRNIALNQSQALNTIRGTTEDILAKLSSFGWTGATLAEVTKSVSADNARKSLLPQLQNDKTHGQVTITYFPKQVDGAVVFNALREGGFNVTKGAGNDVNKDLPTNAIWVGDHVSPNDTKFVALTVVRAGVGIKSIRRFKDGSGAKANLIEVGTDHNILNNPPLTVEEIQNLPPLLPRDATASSQTAS
jgi:hypothetical protein